MVNGHVNHSVPTLQFNSLHPHTHRPMIYNSPQDLRAPSADRRETYINRTLQSAPLISTSFPLFARRRSDWQQVLSMAVNPFTETVAI